MLRKFPDKMKLLVRHTYFITKCESSDVSMQIIASFYRPHIDSGYQAMIASMVELGDFDAFIGSMVQGLLVQGKIF